MLSGRTTMGSKRESGMIEKKRGETLRSYSLRMDLPYLLTEWDAERNAPLTPDAVYAKSRKRVWWRCEKGHEWDVSLDVRSLGPYCSRSWRSSGAAKTAHSCLHRCAHTATNGSGGSAASAIAGRPRPIRVSAITAAAPIVRTESCSPVLMIWRRAFRPSPLSGTQA